MAGISAASQSGATINALSEIAGPMMTETPWSSSASKPSTTSRSLPAGSPRAACGDELELAIEATRVGDFGEPEPHRVLERSVALREVVEEADADG